MNDDVDLMQIKIERAKSQLPEDTLNAINSVDWKAAILKMRETKGYSFEQLGDLELETELVLFGLLSVTDYPKELKNRMKIGEAQTNEIVNEMNEQVFSKIKEELIRRTERKKIFAKENPEEEKGQVPEVKTIAQEAEADRKASTEALSSHGIEILGGASLVAPAPASFVPPRVETPNMEKAPAALAANTSIVVPPATSPIISSPAPSTPPEPIKKEIDSILAQKLSNSFQIPAVKTEHSLENLTKTSQPSGASSTPSTPTSYPPKSDPYRLPPE